MGSESEQRESSSPRVRFWKKDGHVLNSMKILSVTVVSGDSGGAAMEESGKRVVVVDRKRRERRVS